MTARGFVAFTHTLMVDLYGSEPVEEWLTAGVLDEVTARRQANMVAATLLDGELG